MSRFIKTAVLALFILGGVWLLINQDQIDDPADVVSLVKQRLSGLQVSQPRATVAPALPHAATAVPVVRIASFKLTGDDANVLELGSSRWMLENRLNMLTDICRRYDAIALQGVDGRDDAWLQLLTDTLNSNVNGAEYFFINDRGGENFSKTQSAILFNRRTLELDQLNWYTVNDPDQLMQREPLVGWFRTRVPNPDEAFTFTLANIELQSTRPELELAYLGELFRAIRNDGRGEDDVIIAGDFNASDDGLQPVFQRAGLTWVVSNTATDVRKSGQFDNLVFSQLATTEFTGRGGVFDFMRRYNLRVQDAALLSERLPVWAEFSAREASGVRRVAETNGAGRR